MNVTYLVCDTNTVQNLEQSTTKALPVVCVVDFREAKQRAFALPLCWCLFLNPMACDGEVAVSITSLPCITGNIYCPANILTLRKTDLDEKLQ